VRNFAVSWKRERLEQGVFSKCIVDEFVFANLDPFVLHNQEEDISHVYILKGVDILSISFIFQEVVLFGEAKISGHVSGPTCRVPWLVELMIGNDALGKSNFEDGQTLCRPYAICFHPLRILIFCIESVPLS
jgi:hypothetical protein